VALRYPYGEHTSRVNDFSYEEIAGDPIAATLWGSGALPATVAATERFAREGAATPVAGRSFAHRLGPHWPLETFMSDRIAEELQGMGLSPVCGRPQDTAPWLV
jgi:predicted component of type VI protein secretion system